VSKTQVNQKVNSRDSEICPVFHHHLHHASSSGTMAAILASSSLRITIFI